MADSQCGSHSPCLLSLQLKMWGGSTPHEMDSCRDGRVTLAASMFISWNVCRHRVRVRIRLCCLLRNEQSPHTAKRSICQPHQRLPGTAIRGSVLRSMSMHRGAVGGKTRS